MSVESLAPAGDLSCPHCNANLKRRPGIPAYHCPNCYLTKGHVLLEGVCLMTVGFGNRVEKFLDELMKSDPELYALERRGTETDLAYVPLARRLGNAEIAQIRRRLRMPRPGSPTARRWGGLE